ncbi:MAG: helix-turn-helix domain-containing protein [Vicinamibacterales bacterium]
MAEEQPSLWLTVNEARLIAKVGARLLYREITAGRLRAARVGGRRDIRIHRDWISEWLEASAKPVEVRR